MILVYNRLLFQLFLVLQAVNISLCLNPVQNYTDCYVQMPALIGNGQCDNFVPYNTPICGEDGGDCSAFNKAYPGCEAPRPELVGDGSCQNVFPYNTDACKNDGGDCTAFRSTYPDCFVIETNWIGDGQCQDFAPYNSKACGYDGGDCNIAKKRDMSDRNVGISAFSVMGLVILVAIGTYLRKKRNERLTRTSPAASEPEVELGNNHDSKPQARDEGEEGKSGGIDVIDLSGDIEEGTNVDIQMPIALSDDESHDHSWSAENAVKSVVSDTVKFLGIDSIDIQLKGDCTRIKKVENKLFHVEFSYFKNGSDEQVIFKSVDLKHPRVGTAVTENNTSYFAAVSYFINELDFAVAKDHDLKCEFKMTELDYSDPKIIADAVISGRELLSTKGFVELHLNPIDNSYGITIEKGSTLELRTIKQNWPEQYAEYEPPTKGEVDYDMERYFEVLTDIFPKFVRELEVIDAKSLPFPKDEPDSKLEMITQFKGLQNAEFSFPYEDEHEPFDPEMRKQLESTIRLEFNPQKNTPFEGDRPAAIYEARQIAGNTLQVQLDADNKLVMWEDYLSDKAMKRIFFSSLGQHVVTKFDEGGYEANFMNLHSNKLAYREGYESLACIVRLNGNGNITEIQEPIGNSTIMRTYTPAEPSDSLYDRRMWEWLKKKVRSALFTEVANLHLVELHYTWGNNGITAMRKFLPIKHKFRIAFSGHFHRTAFTCALASPILYHETGLLSRLKSFEYKGGLESLFISNLENFKFQTYPVELKERGLTDCKFHAGAQDGKDLHKIIVKYVGGMIAEFYPTEEALENDKDMANAYAYLADNLNGTPREFSIENMKKVWGEIIFRVSGLHSSIGNVQGWALDPSFMDMRLKRPPAEDSEGEWKNYRWDLASPKESVFGIALISAFATAEAPTLAQSWEHLFECDAFNKQTPEPYHHFREDLANLEEEITERNKRRACDDDKLNGVFPCVDFLPSHCELSIAG